MAKLDSSAVPGEAAASASFPSASVVSSVAGPSDPSPGGPLVAGPSSASPRSPSVSVAGPAAPLPSVAPLVAGPLPPPSAPALAASAEAGPAERSHGTWPPLRNSPPVPSAGSIRLAAPSAMQHSSASQPPTKTRAVLLPDARAAGAVSQPRPHRWHPEELISVDAIPSICFRWMPAHPSKGVGCRLLHLFSLDAGPSA